jgi:oligopeptide/dipeptide ABC transporter ATP-binding protein
MDPALTILLMTQPKVISDVLSNATFRGRGLTARFLYCLPTSTVGERRFQSRPVSDAVYQRYEQKIINLLEDLQKEYNLTYLFISHDLSVVQHISDTVGVMYLGNMVEYADKTEIFANPLHPYTKALFSAIPVPDPTVKMNRIILGGSIPSPANPPSGCKFHTRCRECMEVCRYAAPEWLEAEEGHFCACHLYDDAEAKARAEQVMAEAKAKEKEAAETAKKEAG